MVYSFKLHLVPLLAGVCMLVIAGCGPSDEPRDASAASPAGEAPAAPALPPAGATSGRPRIVFLGDSLTAGYGLSKQEAVPALIQGRLDSSGYPYEVVNAGVSGDTSAGGLSRLDWSLEGDVRVLVVELGANDGLRGLPVAQMRENLATILRRARERGIAVVLTGMEAPPNYGPAYTAEFRQAFVDLAEEFDVPFIPFYLQGVAGRPELNIADGIHPNPAGSRIISESVWQTLEPLLAGGGTQTR